MLILVPMDGDNTQESKITTIKSVKKWALLNIEEGELIEVNHYDDRADIKDCIEAVVVANEQEYVYPFMQEQIMVLVAHTQHYIDDIVEAYLFRELHEMPFA